MTIQLTHEHDYITVDTQEWLEDRAEVDKAMTNAVGEWLEDRYQNRYSIVDSTMSAWVEETYPDATAGIYGEGQPIYGHTSNDDNYFESDFGWTYFEVNGETYLITQYGYSYWATPTVWRCTDIEGGAALLNWSGGYAYCEGECSTQWVIEYAYMLHPNGGGADSVRIDDLKLNDNNQPLCPTCNTPITFWSN